MHTYRCSLNCCLITYCHELTKTYSLNCMLGSNRRICIHSLKVFICKNIFNKSNFSFAIKEMVCKIYIYILNKTYLLIFGHVPSDQKLFKVKRNISLWLNFWTIMKIWLFTYFIYFIKLLNQDLLFLCYTTIDLLVRLILLTQRPLKFTAND